MIVTDRLFSGLLLIVCEDSFFILIDLPIRAFQIAKLGFAIESARKRTLEKYACFFASLFINCPIQRIFQLLQIDIAH